MSQAALAEEVTSDWVSYWAGDGGGFHNLPPKYSHDAFITLDDLCAYIDTSPTAVGVRNDCDRAAVLTAYTECIPSFPEGEQPPPAYAVTDGPRLVEPGDFVAAVCHDGDVHWIGKGTLATE